MSSPTSWFERCQLKVLAATFPGNDRVPGLDPERCRSFLGRLRREAPLQMRCAFALCTWVFLLSTPLTVASPRPSLLLSAEALDRHAHRLATHRSYLLRQSALLIKTVASLCWGADPSVRAALGMHPYGPDPGTWRQA